VLFRSVIGANCSRTKRKHEVHVAQLRIRFAGAADESPDAKHDAPRLPNHRLLRLHRLFRLGYAKERLPMPLLLY